MIKWLRDFFDLLDEKFPNWKTTFAGFLLAVSFVVDDWSHGQLDAGTFFKALSSAAVGYWAKVFNVTGGSKPQTPEAAERAEVIDTNALKVAKSQVAAGIAPTVGTPTVAPPEIK